MTLSRQSMRKLADAISQDVIDYILEDQRFYDVMSELVSDAIVDKVGELDPVVHTEILCTLCGYIGLTFDAKSIL
jgi:hypothetical protein